MCCFIDKALPPQTLRPNFSPFPLFLRTSFAFFFPPLNGNQTKTYLKKKKRKTFTRSSHIPPYSKFQWLRSLTTMSTLTLPSITPPAITRASMLTGLELSAWYVNKEREDLSRLFSCMGLVWITFHSLLPPFCILFFLFVTHRGLSRQSTLATLRFNKSPATMW